MTAKSKGLTEYQVLRNHALPNGMPPMIALIAMDVAFIIGGAYQVEYIFNYPGIGYRTIKAINELDFPLLQFIVVIGGVAVVLANFVADLMLIYIDPRIKIT
jgi:peptide/nickel transport system permease protein